MKIHFTIHYQTVPGEYLCIIGSDKSLGGWRDEQAVKLVYGAGGFWSAEIAVADAKSILEYEYRVVGRSGHCSKEWGGPRKIDLSGLTHPVMFFDDRWRNPPKEERVLFSSAFSNVIMRPRKLASPQYTKAQKAVLFRIHVPRMAKGQQLCLLGNQPILGDWSGKPLLLECGNQFPEWSVMVDMSALSFPMEYKYGLYDPQKEEVVTLEAGSNRSLDFNHDVADEYLLVRTDELFRRTSDNWKGAGVSVPVFSLRSERGFGVGEFHDLKHFTDWAKSTGMKLVQILPINDTSATFCWLDSYPYKAISVMALHPLYLNLHDMGVLGNKKTMAEFARIQQSLNQLDYVDYPAVIEAKMKYCRLLFAQEKDRFFGDKAYQAFFDENKNWLVPYAAFSYLRDLNKTPDFRQWGKFSQYDEKAIEKLCQPGSTSWDGVALYYFIQFHLNQQLAEVADYARSNGVVLKGDIPIGISPNSVEAWTEPGLFNLGAQAGAPPDAFAVKGQNWGFPTYNWDVMSGDRYAWWTKRLQKMSAYFDAYRIDHILGFFRIWEIPEHAVEGLLGYFSPALPMTAEEIGRFGLGFDYERMVKPYIRHHMLNGLFGESAEGVVNTYLDETGFCAYQLKEQFNTQQKINRHFLNGIVEEELSPADRKIRNGLFDLVANVLFVQTGENQWHPRISLHRTTSFHELDTHSKCQLDRLYIHYFYHRHNDFWYQKGLEILPAIKAASNMLVCGEDLGMVPACVPPVMDHLNIISLEIQRMPKDPEKKFAHPADAPYLSVCTTSTHDMSTIRGWWEEDRGLIQDFYHAELGLWGEVPQEATPAVCKKMLEQHVFSSAMLVVFPVQDLVSLDQDLRWDNIHEEQINIPSNVRHRWRYRMKQSVDDLKNATHFNQDLTALFEKSGRISD